MMGRMADGKLKKKVMAGGMGFDNGILGWQCLCLELAMGVGWHGITVVRKVGGGGAMVTAIGKEGDEPMRSDIRSWWHQHRRGEDNGRRWLGILV